MRRLIGTGPLCTPLRTLMCALMFASVLSGCGGMRLIDTQVRAASSLSDPASLQGASFKFERSPLQPAPGIARDPAGNPVVDTFESQAEQALSEVGLTRNDDAATLSVLLGLRLTPYLVDNGTRVYGAPYPFAYGAWGSGRRFGGMGFGMGWGSRFPPSTLYRHELQILMRDVRSGQLVYETQAVHDGPWSDKHIVPALLSAALKNFPQPCMPACQVNIEIPR